MTATPRGAATKASVRLAVVWALLLLLGYAVGRLVTDAHPSWDAAVVADLRGSDGGTVTAIMRFITDLGGTIVLDAVFVAGMIVLLLRGATRSFYCSPARGPWCWCRSSNEGSIALGREVTIFPARLASAGLLVTPAAPWRSTEGSS